MIPLFKVYMNDGAGKSVNDVLYSGYIGEGPKVLEFERALEPYTGNVNNVTTNSGTSALHLAYHIASNASHEGEVITTAMTCTATNTPIVANGLKPVWADIDPVSGNIDPEDVKRKITSKTKAIVAVHWGGTPCDLDALKKISYAYNIPIIEDAAHAFGAKVKDNFVGSISDFTCFSFQAIKHLTCIDGGLLTTKLGLHAERAKLLRWFGINRQANDSRDLRCEIDVAEAGYKFHMNDVNATVGLQNLQDIDIILSAHRENAEFYNDCFSNYSKSIKVQPVGDGDISSYWLYTIHVNNRDRLMDILKEKGVASSKVHSSNLHHSMFKDSYVELKNTVQFENTHLCIPVGHHVSKADREFIAEQIIKNI